MKQYKVGDTIYIKDEVKTVNQLDSYRTYRGIRNGWLANISIVDELPTAKPVLPKGVADLVKIHKDGYGSLGSFIESVYEPETEVDEWVNAWVYQNSQSDVRYKMLVDAWYNGYTVEPEKKFLVKIPHVIGGIYRKTTTGSPVTASHRNEWLNISKEFKSRYEFTDEEIIKFNLQDCEKELVTDDSED